MRGGEAQDDLEGSLPQARDDADLDGRRVRREPGLAGSRRRPVLPTFSVDIETGVVRVNKIVAIQDTGPWSSTR